MTALNSKKKHLREAEWCISNMIANEGAYIYSVPRAQSHPACVYFDDQ